MIDERQMGREIAREVPGMIREMGCQPCGIGTAIARIERRHGISPVFDWQGARAREAGHRCSLTTWDKAPIQLPLAGDQGSLERVPGEDDNEASL